MKKQYVLILVVLAVLVVRVPSALAETSLANLSWLIGVLQQQQSGKAPSVDTLIVGVAAQKIASPQAPALMEKYEALFVSRVASAVASGALSASQGALLTAKVREVKAFAVSVATKPLVERTALLKKESDDVQSWAIANAIPDDYTKFFSSADIGQMIADFSSLTDAPATIAATTVAVVTAPTTSVAVVATPVVALTAEATVPAVIVAKPVVAKKTIAKPAKKKVTTKKKVAAKKKAAIVKNIKKQ